MWSNPAAFQTPSFSWMRLNQKKLLSPQGVVSGALTTLCCPQNQADKGRKNKPIYGYFVLHTKNLALKPRLCHPSPCTGWCILVLSTCCQLGPSGRLLSPAAAVLAVSSVQCVFKPWLETYWPLPTWRGFFANSINFLTISQVISYTVGTQNIRKIKVMAPLIALRGIFTPAGSFLKECKS